jgi:hypothetical protein
MSSGRIEIPDGYYHLIIVQDGEVIHSTANFSLSHVEFVKRKVGTLPADAWVGSVYKTSGVLEAFNSFTFYGNQLPAAP